MFNRKKQSRTAIDKQILPDGVASLEALPIDK
jgi:hypothetical protein